YARAASLYSHLPFLARLLSLLVSPLFPYTTLFRSGFLVGDLCECPDSNVSYLIIDAALRLSQPIYGDRTTDVDRLAQAQRRIDRSEEHTSELQSRFDLVCRLLLEKKKRKTINVTVI